MNTALPAFDLIAAALFSACDEMAVRTKACATISQNRLHANARGYIGQKLLT